MTDQTSKTVNYETCVVSKMHKIINRSSNACAIKSFEVLHLDPTINSIGFDEKKCIAHFIDEFILFNWVYFFKNHKKKTLFSIFKSLINLCGRASLVINVVIAIMFLDQSVILAQLAMTLQRFKTLYFRNQFRPCAARCEQLLFETKSMIWKSDVLFSFVPFSTEHEIQSNLLFIFYLHFYSALSTESLARLSHNLSVENVKIYSGALCTKWRIEFDCFYIWGFLASYIDICWT